MSEQKRTGRPPYPPEVRERAVRMVFDHQDEYSSQWKAVESISAKLSINHETLRIWVRRAETDAGQRPGLTTNERARMRELEREVKELRRANEILKSAAVFFGGGARPPTAEIVAYIDAHRDRFGVEPICRVLTEHGCKIAPNTYWVAKKRPPSARAVRDEQLKREIARVHVENLDVYGADKVWAQLNREGTRVARCTVERLMRDLGLSGVRRGRSYKVTTHADERQRRPSDLVKRDFTAPSPNRLWVADLTYVKTHAGWVYAAFVIDVFSRMVVGWQLSNSLRSDLAIDALEMAVWNRTRAGQVLDGLVHHSDRGVQYLSIRYSERLAENDIVASVGSRGDSFDNAMAESFNGLYKWELIYPQGPWKGLDDVEFATLGYIDWFNHRRLHGEITDENTYVTPAELEAAYYRQKEAALEAVAQ
ncbi:MAG: IS3 family transposase [Candidatus Dormibacteria bacterium]